MADDYPKMAQGPAKLATEEDIAKDDFGITDPNLHRRIDDEATPLHPSETIPDSYTLSVKSVNSYRTTEHHIHDDSSDSEIP